MPAQTGVPVVGWVRHDEEDRESGAVVCMRALCLPRRGAGFGTAKTKKCGVRPSVRRHRAPASCPDGIGRAISAIAQHSSYGTAIPSGLRPIRPSNGGTSRHLSTELYVYGLIHFGEQ